MNSGRAAKHTICHKNGLSLSLQCTTDSGKFIDTSLILGLFTDTCMHISKSTLSRISKFRLLNAVIMVHENSNKQLRTIGLIPAPDRKMSTFRVENKTSFKLFSFCLNSKHLKGWNDVTRLARTAEEP